MKKKLFIITLVGALGLVILLSFRAHFYSESYSRQLAEEKVIEYCSRNNIEPSSLIGPRNVCINATWGFDWVVDDEQRNQIIGVNIFSDGEIELYISPNLKDDSTTQLH